MNKLAWVAFGCIGVISNACSIVPNNGVDGDFAFVGRTEFGGASLVAIGRNAVMTARHVNLGAKITFSADGSGPLFGVDLSSRTDIGNSDIRLYRTTEDLPGWYDIDFSPLSTTYTHDSSFVFTGTGQESEILVGVGFGRTGALNGAGTGYNVDNSSPYFRRKGSFFSDSRGPASLDLGGGNIVGPFSSILSFLIENGDSTLAGGDSGGGLFREVGGVKKLVGISSFTAGEGRMFAQGTTLFFASGFAELAPHQNEIRAFLVPEPASIAGVSMALSFLLRRRKTKDR